MNNKHTKTMFWGFASCIVSVCVCVYFLQLLLPAPPVWLQVMIKSATFHPWCLSDVTPCFSSPLILSLSFPQLCCSLYVCLIYLCVVVSVWTLVVSSRCVGKICTATFLHLFSTYMSRRSLIPTATIDTDSVCWNTVPQLTETANRTNVRLNIQFLCLSITRFKGFLIPENMEDHTRLPYLHKTSVFTFDRWLLLQWAWNHGNSRTFSQQTFSNISSLLLSFWSCLMF